MESMILMGESLRELHVRPVERGEEARYQEQMAQHHYLGALRKIGETLWYVATWREHWVAPLSLSRPHSNAVCVTAGSAGIFVRSMAGSS